VKKECAVRQPSLTRKLAPAFLAVLLAGCASDASVMGSGTTITASDKTRMTSSGFLTDYKRLQPATGGEGMECWRAADLKAGNYDQMLISRIVVSIAPPKDPSAAPTIDPADLKTLTDYFHDSLAKAIKPQMPLADKAGPRVIVLRIALTHLVPTNVGESVAGTLIPFAFVAEAGAGVATGRPAGATPYMGETGMEMQFRDGVSGTVLAECRDTEVGRKYAGEIDSGASGAAQTWAGGYMNSFQSWSYAKNAFDKWSELVARRIGQLRAG
jgi:hypothetical protein